MAINKEGVELLKADMRANVKHYDQFVFGCGDECGTVQCMAGFCLLRQKGFDAYVSEVKWYNRYQDDSFPEACVSAGILQLGIEPIESEVLQIFETPEFWPLDLYSAYQSASNSAARVEVACAALDRLQEDGSIAELD